MAHILVVTEYFTPQIGGLAEIVKSSLEAIRASGHRATVLWVSPQAYEGRDVHCITRDFTGYGPFLGRLLRSFAVRRGILRIHKSDPIDVVEMPNWNALGAVTAISKQWPVVTRVSTSVLQTEPNSSALFDRTRRALLMRMEQAALRFSCLVIFNSRTHAEDYQVALAMRNRPLENSCVVPLSTPDPGDNQTKASTPSLLFIGRGTWRKGTDLLDQVLTTLRHNHVDFHISLVGVSPTDLPEFCIDGHIPDNAEFFSDLPQHALSQLYKNTGVVLMPSRYESFGLVTLEAMAAGRPVVAFDTSGTQDLLEDGKSGVLIAPFDVEAMSEAVTELLQKPMKAKEVGALARLRYVNEFHPSLFNRRMGDIYNRLSRHGSGFGSQS